MAQTTKSPEAVKKTEVVKNLAVANTNISDSLLNTWAEGLDRACIAQKELEDLILNALDNQKELWEQLSDNIFRIEAEQQKLFGDVRESIKSNLQSVFGPSASQLFDQFNSQVDLVNNQLQELTLNPYREGVNFFSQSQDQFKQTVQNGFEQQQKIREELVSQVKSTQQTYVNLYEENMKVVFGLFR
jgi:hypothetical protein